MSWILISTADNQSCEQPWHKLKTESWSVTWSAKAPLAQLFLWPLLGCRQTSMADFPLGLWSALPLPASVSWGLMPSPRNMRLWETAMFWGSPHLSWVASNWKGLPGVLIYLYLCFHDSNMLCTCLIGLNQIETLSKLKTTELYNRAVVLITEL